MQDRCQPAEDARRLRAKVKFAGHEVLLAKPETYMNLSGLSVRKLVEEFEINPADGLIVFMTNWICLSEPFAYASEVEPQATTGSSRWSAALGTDEFIRGPSGNSTRPSGTRWSQVRAGAVQEVAVGNCGRLDRTRAEAVKRF